MVERKVEDPEKKEKFDKFFRNFAAFMMISSVALVVIRRWASKGREAKQIEKSDRKEMAKTLEQRHLDEKYGGDPFRFLFSVYKFVLDTHEEGYPDYTVGDQFTNEIKSLFLLSSFFDSMHGFKPTLDWGMDVKDILLLKFLHKNDSSFIKKIAGVSAHSSLEQDSNIGEKRSSVEYIVSFFNSVLGTTWVAEDIDKGRSFVDGRPNGKKPL